MKKQIWGLVLVLCMLAAFVPCVQAATIVDSGTCGDNLTWTLDNDGSLTISGIGVMEDYPLSSHSPFYENNSIKTIVIEDGVTSIGDHAFVSCENLKSVHMPNSVISIGELAFYCCTSLSSLTIRDSVESIGSYCFSCCISLESIKLPSEMEYFGERVFEKCVALKSINIPECTNTIDYYMMFAGCESLTNIELPKGTTAIDWYTFASCTSLEIIGIPSSVKSIGNGAFYNCTALKDVYYGGTEAQWETISIDSQNEYLTNATIHYNSTLPENNPQIISATASKNGNAYVFDVQTADVTAGCQLITALYSGNKMVGVKSTALKENDNSKSVSIAADSATSAKVFIWDSLSDMRPLCEAKIMYVD